MTTWQTMEKKKKSNNTVLTNWLGQLRGNIWTGMCERLAVCHWQIRKTLCNLLPASILSSSVGGAGCTPRCDGVLLSYFQLLTLINSRLTTRTINSYTVNTPILLLATVFNAPGAWNSKWNGQLYYFCGFINDAKWHFLECGVGFVPRPCLLDIHIANPCG